MKNSIIIVSHFAYSELLEQRNVNVTKIRDSQLYDALAFRYYGRTLRGNTTVNAKKTRFFKNYNYNDLGSYYLYIEIKNHTFSIKNVTKWQHWRHFRNVCFLGGAPRHAAHRVNNSIQNKINFLSLIYMRIARDTRRGFKKY